MFEQQLTHQHMERELNINTLGMSLSKSGVTMAIEQNLA